jgi:hypothetical protein
VTLLTGARAKAGRRGDTARLWAPRTRDEDAVGYREAAALSPRQLSGPPGAPPAAGRGGGQRWRAAVGKLGRGGRRRRRRLAVAVAAAGERGRSRPDQQRALELAPLPAHDVCHDHQDDQDVKVRRWDMNARHHPPASQAPHRCRVAAGRHHTTSDRQLWRAGGWSKQRPRCSLVVALPVRVVLAQPDLRTSRQDAWMLRQQHALQTERLRTGLVAW